MIHILLIALFAVMLLMTITVVKNRLLRGFFIVSYAFGIFFVIFPDASTTIAKCIGVNRGLDLLFCLIIVFLLNCVFYLLHHVYLLRRKMTDLARYISLKEAGL